MKKIYSLSFTLLFAAVLIFSYSNVSATVYCNSIYGQWTCLNGQTCGAAPTICLGTPTQTPVSPSGDTVCPEGQICNPLAYGNFEDLVNAIIGFLIKIGIPIATIMFVISGIVFVTSAGDPGRLKTARSIMIYTAVGLAVILIASGLIKVLQSLLGGS